MKIYSIEILWTFIGKRMDFDFICMIIVDLRSMELSGNLYILAKAIPLNSANLL